jgi:hypothetical protein
MLIGPGSSTSKPSTICWIAAARRPRRIEVWLEDKQETLVLLTNHLEWSVCTMAAIYKDRWQIELFFKALKQYLKIKTFVGTTANAVHIPIWTAVRAAVMIHLLRVLEAVISQRRHMVPLGSVTGGGTTAQGLRPCAAVVTIYTAAERTMARYERLAYEVFTLP